MPSAIVVTVGGSTSNSYATVAEATTYLGDRLGTSSWTSASADEKIQALLQAAVQLDMQKFHGQKRYDVPQGDSSFQAMQWPRTLTRASDLPLEFQRYYSNFPEGQWSADSDGDAIIPTEVKRAQMEQALSLLKNQGGQVDRASLRAQGVTSFQLGGYGETLGKSGQGFLSPESRSLLMPVLKRGAEIARA